MAIIPLPDVVIGKSIVDAAVIDTLETVFNSNNLAEVEGCVLWIENTGPDTVTVVNVEVSPDNITFFTLDTATFANLAAAGKKFLKIEGFPFFRVQANCATLGSTTLDIGYTVKGGFGI